MIAITLRWTFQFLQRVYFFSQNLSLIFSVAPLNFSLEFWVVPLILFQWPHLIFQRFPLIITVNFTIIFCVKITHFSVDKHHFSAVSLIILAHFTNFLHFLFFFFEKIWFFSPSLFFLSIFAFFFPSLFFTRIFPF